MNLSKTNVKELKTLQPELAVIGNKISGCFYLSASLENKSKNRGCKLNYYSWNSKSNNDKHICDHFYIDIILNENLYPDRVFSTGISFNENKIPEEYWHVNPDNSLCLGEQLDILEMQKQYSFAQFINILLMQYFYYMAYVKKYLREPWKTYRHGLFAMLEIAYSSKNIGNDLKLLNKYMECCKKEWGKLLNKTKKEKINNRDNCPFCKNKKLAKNCKTHRKQIKGYNNLSPFIRL